MATSVGAYLRETRAARGLTLEQVSQATHIRKSYLEALENEQRDSLPSAVQGRGFLRLYAGYLNLPTEALVQSWEGKAPLVVNQPIPESPALSEPQPAPPPEPAPEVKPARKPVTGPLPRLPESTPALEHQTSEGPIPVEFHESSGQAPKASGSQAVFLEIGAKLRSQRELLGLSRSEVERYTRLRQHYLQALEEGRLDLLPSPVQGRGMLSNYATFLNLDEEALMLRFAEGLQLRRLERIPNEPPQPLQAKKRPARAASPLRRFLTPDLVFGVVVVVAILAFAVRTALSINEVQSHTQQPTARAIADVLLTPDETLQATASPEGGTAQPALAEEDQASGSETQVAIVENANATPSLTVEPTLAPMNNDPLQVYIIANQRAYLRVTVDNKEKFNGRVVPGNAYAFSGTKRIELLTGNAAAIQVFYNQNDLGTLGVAGQVADLVFVPGSVVTATPFLTSTPTPGPLGTETSRPTATPPATATVTPLIP